MSTPEELGQFAGDHDKSVSPEQERADISAYLDEFHRRLPLFADRVAAFPTGTAGSIEWYRDIGKYWRAAREGANLTRYAAAARAGIHVNEIRFLERGCFFMEEVIRSLRPYSEALGNPGLYEEFGQRFIDRFMPDNTPPTPQK